MFKVNNEDIRTTSSMSFSYLSCELSTYFTPIPNVSIIDFEQVNFGYNVQVYTS